MPVSKRKPPPKKAKVTKKLTRKDGSSYRRKSAKKLCDQDRANIGQVFHVKQSDGRMIRKKIEERVRSAKKRGKSVKYCVFVPL
jgi:hypothetical protein